MKLLIITQKVDKEDPILGFFHKWIEEFSKKFEQVTVICLERGEYYLPQNVKVFSLGKERFENSDIENSKLKIFRRLKYIWNFYRYIIGLALKYDVVFVHMNQEYVLLGGIFWKILRKKVYFWRNHPKGSLLTKIAVFLSDKIFCASDSAFVVKYKKTKIMPVGIDTDMFKHEIRDTKYEIRSNKILFLGRMDRIKRPDLLIEALNILNNQNTDFICNFYGDPTPNTGDYYESLKKQVEKYRLINKVNFYRGVSNYETPKIYSEYKIFVNLTPSGSMDKTILESVSCGCIPVVINTFFIDIFDSNMIIKEDAKDISNKIKFWLEADREKVNNLSLRLQKYVLENHSLSVLMNKLEKELKN